MEKLRFVTRRSGWYALKSKAFWLFLILGAAVAGAGYYANSTNSNNAANNANASTGNVITNNADLIMYIGIGIAAFAILILICKIICCHHIKYYFYDSKVVVRTGVFHRKENSYTFLGVTGVETEQTFINRIFNIGYILCIDLVGKYDIYGQEKTVEGFPSPIPCIAKFRKLKKYLAKKMIKSDEVSKLVNIG